MWKKLVFSHWSGCGAILCTALLIGACNHSRDVVTEKVPPDVLTQHNRIFVRPGTQELVYFPVPYVVPPRVVLSGEHPEQFELVDVKPDHFAIRSLEFGYSRAGYSPREVRWEATGKVGLAPSPMLQPQPVGTPLQPVPAQQLPPPRPVTEVAPTPQPLSAPDLPPQPRPAQ